MASPIPAFNITEILTDTSFNTSPEGWLLYLISAFVLGIVIGGTMKGLARLLLGLILISGFGVLALLFLKKNDLLSTIASIVFGLVMVLFSILAKAGKSVVLVKR